MVKNLHLKAMLLLMAFIVGAGTVWAVDPISFTATKATLPTATNGTTIGTVSGTNSSSWAYSVTQATKSGKNPYVAYADASGWQLGSGNSPCTAFSFSTNSISGTIKEIKVVSGSASASSSINVTVGGAAFGTQSQKTGTGATVGTQTFSGTATGEIVISATASSGAFYLKSVEVSYETADPTAPSVVLSPTSLDFGRVNYGETKQMIFTVTPANLTADLSISCNNDKYEVAPTTIASTVTEATNVTVTSKPTALTDVMAGTITISGGGLTANATLALSTTVSDPNAGDGSAENPYSVKEARDAIDAGEGITNVYVKGIVSEIVTAYSSQYGNITYNISADGATTSDQLQAYRGKSYNGDNFTSEDDIQVGDKVVVYGTLKKYNSTYEFDQNNQLVSLSREKSDPTVSFNDGSARVGKTLDLSTLFQSNSDGAVTYSITSGTELATIEGSLLTATAVGTVTVKAVQEETAIWNATEATATITINEALQLMGIEITTAPTKTAYTVGESFDPAGMVVTARYSDQSTEAVTTYTYSPTGALTLNDTEITVSYTEGNVTKTATQTITVEEVIDYATLPFEWEGGISSDFKALTGVDASGLGSDYAQANAPYRLKFDTTGDYILIKTNEQPGIVSIGIKQFGGTTGSSFTLQGSSDGTNFTDVETLTVTASQNSTEKLTSTKQFAKTDRYVKIVFTCKSNVGVGPISIAKVATNTLLTS